MKCASFARQFLNSFSNLPVLNYFSVKKIQAWYWVNELRHRHINYFCINCFFSANIMIRTQCLDDKCN